jgi:hypothetical protein
MSDWNCPVEGCDFGEEQQRSRAGVLSHIHAKADNDHDEEAARVVEGADSPPVDHPSSDDDPNQAAEDTEQGDDEASDPPESEEATGSTTPSEGGDGEIDPVDHPADDQTEPPESGEMATDEEYNEQYGDDEEIGVEEGADPPEPPAEGGGYPLPTPSVSGSTILLVGGLLLVAFLAYKLLGGDAAADYDPPEEQADADDDEGMLTEDVVESGTGGVQV